MVILSQHSNSSFDILLSRKPIFLFCFLPLCRSQYNRPANPMEQEADATTLEHLSSMACMFRFHSIFRLVARLYMIETMGLMVEVDMCLLYGNLNTSQQVIPCRKQNLMPYINRGEGNDTSLSMATGSRWSQGDSSLPTKANVFSGCGDRILRGDR